MKKAVIAIAMSAALALAAGNHYTVELTTPSEINGQTLQPGVYRMELNGNHAVLKSGKVKVEADAVVENANKKFSETGIRYGGPNNSKIEEIRIGGTNVKVRFEKAQASGN